MELTLAQKMENLLVLAGGEMSIPKMLGSLREGYAVRPTRRQLKRATYAGGMALKRDGSHAIRIDEEAAG